jgi:serine O-acetyltransferase
MFERIKEDLQTVLAKDPAARTVWEVVAVYPGLHAIWLHRLAHFLWQHRFLLLGRLVSYLNRWLTGVEIHPAARIGRRFFIDHGMGVVIGETAEIGDDVLMYKGAVLGGTCLEKTKRHPTVGDSVIIGAGATILGPVTVGANARIGAGSVVIKPVPAGATIVGVPGRMAGLSPSTGRGMRLQHNRLPDPMLRVLNEALDQQRRLEGRVRELELAPARVAPSPLPAQQPSMPLAREADIRQALKDVIDPEVGVNVVDLGLIREIAFNGGGVEVRMVLTSPAWPSAGYLVEQVRRKVKTVVDGKPVKVVLVDEIWSWDDAAPRLLWGDGI